METLVRTIFVLVLLAGVFFLGGKILNKSSLDALDTPVHSLKVENKDPNNVKESADVPENSIGSKKPVSSEIAAERIKAEDTSKSRKKMVPEETEPEMEAAIRKVDLKPMDMEDRRLTAEVLNNSPAANTAVSNDSTKAVVSIRAENLAENKVKEPLDFNRISRINEIYAKVSEALEWD